MINKILENLDEMIESQKRATEKALETANEKEVYLETERLLAYMDVREMIKNAPNNEEPQE